MTEDRLRSFESTWDLFMDEHRRAIQGTPPALVAQQQVKELIVEVRKLRRLLDEALDGWEAAPGLSAQRFSRIAAIRKEAEL